MKTVGAPITSAFPPGIGTAEAIIFGEGKRAAVTAKDADVRFPVAAQSADGKVWAAWEECNERGSVVVVREIMGEME